MAIIMQNGQAVGGGIAVASELPTVDTEGIVTTAGGNTNGQAMFDELADRSVGHDASITELQAVDTDMLATNRNNGSHNLLPLRLIDLQAINTAGTWNNRTYTYNGVQFYVAISGGNGYVTRIDISRVEANSNRALFHLKYDEIFNKYRNMKLSGCPSGGSTDSYCMRIRQLGGDYTNFAVDTGSGATIPNTAIADVSCYMSIYIESTYPTSQQSWYPMIRHGSDRDTVYKYYAPTNIELNTVEAVSTGISGLAAYRCCRVVTLVGKISTEVSTTTKGWVDIGTITARELWPYSEMRFAGLDYKTRSSRAETSLMMRLASDGKLQVYLFDNESAKPYFVVTYLLYF